MYNITLVLILTFSYKFVISRVLKRTHYDVGFPLQMWDISLSELIFSADETQFVPEFLCNSSLLFNRTPDKASPLFGFNTRTFSDSTFTISQATLSFWRFIFFDWIIIATSWLTQSFQTWRRTLIHSVWFYHVQSKFCTFIFFILFYFLMNVSKAMPGQLQSASSQKGRENNGHSKQPDRQQ